MNNLKAGEGSPYWYEWSVGLLYIVKMLNPDNKIKTVVLQSEDNQSLDDVVITYEDETVEYIQVKHTRVNDRLTFTNMIEGDIDKSYLFKCSSEWKKMKNKNSGKIKVVFFTNREMGKQKYFPEGEWERPALSLFWKNIKEQVNSLCELTDTDIDINKIVVKKEWETAWNEWKKRMSGLDSKEQVHFLYDLELMSNQEDLEEIITTIAHELENRFKTTHKKAVSLHQKLCYQLIHWATYIGSKKEIEKEDVMEALSLHGDSIKGEHAFPVCEPFFKSRITFVKNLENRILNGKSRVTFLTGAPGCGKTNIISYLACKQDSIVTLRFHAFKPIIPGDLYVSADLGISNPIDFWSSLFVMLRELFKGRLYEYNVPVSVELIESIDTLRNEVLRLASAWADITEHPTVIAIDGIDHAARSGSSNTFLGTLPLPEAIPQNVRIILAGQPTHQYPEYPDFLSDPNRVEEIQVPNIDKSDLELLYNNNSAIMKYTDYEKTLVINYIAEISKGSTLSGVFAMQEATKYSNFADFKQNSSIGMLNPSIQSYYEYIWKTATMKAKSYGYTIDMYLAAVFSVINKRITAQTMADIYGNGFQVWQWEDILQSLFPIITYGTQGYGVFHNDVRLYLTAHCKKGIQLMPTICGKIADFLIQNDFDEKIKHEIIFKLLKGAKQEEKYIDVFTCEYIIQAYLLKRNIGEIWQQMFETLETLPSIRDKYKILKFSCAVTTMEQYESSLRWRDKRYQSDIEIPFALNSELKPVVEDLLTVDELKNVFSDIDLLLQKDEITRAKQVFLRWMLKRVPDNIYSRFAQNNDVNTINELLEIWGKYARKFRITVEKTDYKTEIEKSSAAYFFRGWLKESVNYFGKNELVFSLENLACCFRPDMDIFLQGIIRHGRDEEIGYILDKKEEVFFSKRNRIMACAWAVRSQNVELCKDWISEINFQKYGYLTKELYNQSDLGIENIREKFNIIADMLYILSYVSEDKFDNLIAIALENIELKSNKSDIFVAENLLSAVNYIAYMEQCLLYKCEERVNKDDFEVILDIILDDKYYNYCFDIDTISFRKKILERILDIIDDMPFAIRDSLEMGLCVKAKTCSGIALLESYWRFLVKKGKTDYIETFFDSWMNHDGYIWKEELSERDYISDVLMKIAKEMHWEEKIKKTSELINVRDIGYVGRKDYSLFNPLQWFKRISKEKNEVWVESGILLMNISEYASKIGDNRAYTQIESTVSATAAKMGVESFFQFFQMFRVVNKEWKYIIFDGIISVLEDGFFYENELLLLWEKTVKYFKINEQVRAYDLSDTRNKIYCADIHEAISLCSKRLGYTDLEKRMEQMAPREYSQKRLSKREHSCIIPIRWYESGYYDDMDIFIRSIDGKNCDEIFEYIKDQFEQNDFSWDYLEYFIQIAKKAESHAITRYKPQIMYMLRQRKQDILEYDGVHRLYNALFPYLTEGEVLDVLKGILEVYNQNINKGYSSVNYGLMTDLENYTYALFSRLSTEDNISGLQEILKMHCMWICGKSTLEIEKAYKLGEKNSINGWADFWYKIETLDN